MLFDGLLSKEPLLARLLALGADCMFDHMGKHAIGKGARILCACPRTTGDT
jgi:hypothetical protein